MKLLLVNKFFFFNGGSETVFFQEREFLKSQNIDVVDFSMEDVRNIESKYSSSFISNIDFQNSYGVFNKIKNGFSFIHSREAVAKLDALLTKERPDIAHLHNIYHQLTPSIIPVLKKHGVKVVMTLHDYKLICPAYLALKHGKICIDCGGQDFWKPFLSNCQRSKSQSLLLSLEALWHKWKKSYNGVDLFISPSQFLADLTSMRFSKNKIKVLTNGINIDEYVASYHDDGYALYFGRISKEKGIKTLLEAHKNLKESISLKVVGTGPLDDEFSSLYSSAEFLGHKTGKELNNLISNAAYVIVPSEWNENCSMVVLEAMALGKPVIGSNIGGIPEQIDDGKTGFLFEMGNVKQLTENMMILHKNKELRYKMGKAARVKLEKKYSLGGHCNELLNIYEELLN